MHAVLTEETEKQMIGTMQDLRVDTVEKNRELEEQLLSIAARRDALHTHLVDYVTPTRKERLERQRAALEIALATLEAELSSRITAAFIQHDASLEAPRARMEHQGEVEGNFYFKEVPQIFDEQCGAAINTMEGERMAHQLSSATVRKKWCWLVVWWLKVEARSFFCLPCVCVFVCVCVYYISHYPRRPHPPLHPQIVDCCAREKHRGEAGPLRRIISKAGCQ